MKHLVLLSFLLTLTSACGSSGSETVADNNETETEPKSQDDDSKMVTEPKDVVMDTPKSEVDPEPEMEADKFAVDNDGFFPLQDGVDRSGLDLDIVETSAASTGQILQRREGELQKFHIDYYRQNFCGTEERRKWMLNFCETIEKTECDEGCPVAAYLPAGTGFVFDQKVITARHVSQALVDDEPILIRLLIDDEVIDFDLQKTIASDHKLPYDIGVLGFSKLENLPEGLLLRDGPIEKDEHVFSVGFPNLTEDMRDLSEKDYGEQFVAQRMTYGLVTEANPFAWSYCKFTNNITESDPMAWVLEEACFGDDKKSWERIEKNIFETTTDMIYGMSGSPVLDAEGKLLGIGTTVRTNMPGSIAPAIHSKAENISEVLNLLR